MSVKIREATPGDANEIAALVRELAEADDESSPVSAAYVKSYLAFPGSAALLAEDQGGAIGLLSYCIRPNLYHAGDICLIEELVVRAGSRGQGVGSALMSALLERLAALGCVEVSVSTMLDNLRAQAFYQRHGFTDEALYLERHFRP
ncbi:MAG: GNAT family N-acetyltransferase [Anaerolineales bacterium]|nr:GNAT family N-acetyltransferase [Anaerolineales bacterium]